MKNMIDYLVLYKNAKLKTKDGIGTLNSINFHENKCIIDYGERLITYSLLYEDLEFTPIKLILREKMTIDECREIATLLFEDDDYLQIMYEKTNNNPDGENTLYTYLAEHKSHFISNITLVKGEPEIWKYMLSINFDLFGLIRKNLAILETNL